MKKQDKRTYTKNMVTWIVVNSTIWVYLTYTLAFIGKEQIAETLSGQIVTVIIGTVITYAAKALFENIFKYRNRKDDEDENQLETETDLP